MDKVNEFEHGADISYNGTIGEYKPGEYANAHYRLGASEELTDNAGAVLDIISDFKTYQLPRLKWLNSYYLGHNAGIMGRAARSKDHADYRKCSAFGKYITDFYVGYMTGIPIKVGSENEAVEAKLKEVAKGYDADAHNTDMMMDLSKFGRAYELVYRNNDGDNEVAVSDPYWTLVIYDETVQMRPIAALRFAPYRAKPGEGPRDQRIKVELYTDQEVIYYEPATLFDNNLKEKERIPHLFGAVPIIEYSNNRFRLGDYEPVIGLIDLYDYSNNDTANYMTDLNEALLVITGDVNRTDISLSKDGRFLILGSGLTPDGSQTSVDAKFINKSYDSVGTEAHKRRLQEDIHKFSAAPNIGDEHFGGNQSGEAMKYKLFGLDQARATKERLFRRGMRRRYILLFNAMNVANVQEAAEALTMTFAPNLPENTMAELQAFMQAGGEISQQTLLSTLSFIDDVGVEMDKVEAERGKLLKIPTLNRFPDEDKDDGR